MTEYAPRRSSQDLNYNHVFAQGNYAMSQFANGNSLHYVYNNGQVPYPTINATYPTYSTPCVPNQQPPSSNNYVPNSSSMTYNCQPPFCRPPTVPSQPRLGTESPFYNAPNMQRPTHRDSRFVHSHDLYPMHDTEGQESFNEDTKASEPLDSAMEGYPDVKDFDELMKRYVLGLSPKKQDKALIHARRAANIKAVLIDKKTTAVESAQFRFWVKKMFTLQPIDPKFPDKKKKICHEGKPVAIREKLFKILIKAHKQCQHGGRDKTSAQVRKVYSWVPKELISRFVKLCPTCQVRRGSARPSPPSPEPRGCDTYMNPQSPGLISPPQSRRDSASRPNSITTMHSPLVLPGATSDFQRQNRWMATSQANLSSNGSRLRSGGLPTPTYNTVPDSTPISNIATVHNSHGGANNMNYQPLNTTNNGTQTGYNSTGLQFANTHSAFQNAYIVNETIKREHGY